MAEKKPARHIPYRNSKLTQLLSDSLGGGALCLLVSCIHPAEAAAEETRSTLHFTAKATAVENRPVRAGTGDWEPSAR